VIRIVLLHYLIDGKPVGGIADELGADRADVRRYLKDGGIVVRPNASGYAGRDPVCEAVRRAGYPSFHYFAQCMAMVGTAEQSDEIGVSEHSLAKVYSVYRGLLVSLKAAGIALPTTQRGWDLERSPELGG
jgi:hypothetical protein